MRRIVRKRVVRRVRRKAAAPETRRPAAAHEAAPEEIQERIAEPDTPQSPRFYRAVPDNGQGGPTVIKAEGPRAPQPRRRSVMPINEKYLSAVEVCVLGRPRFREWMNTILNQVPQINVAFESEGPVTGQLVSSLSATGVVLVDGESGRQMALKAPVRNPDDALGRVNVVLIADPANFKPPHPVAAVVGSHWSILLATSAENPLRLARAVNKAAEGRATTDSGIDPEMIRVANELSSDRKSFRS